MASGIVQQYFQSVYIKSDHEQLYLLQMVFYCTVDHGALLSMQCGWVRWDKKFPFLSSNKIVPLLSFSQVILPVHLPALLCLCCELFFTPILARYFPFFCFTNVISAAVFDSGSNWTQFLFCFLFLILLGLNKLNPSALACQTALVP